MFSRAASALTLCVALVVLLSAGPAYAAAPATTDPAASITATSAVLNGVVDSTSADSSWTFQYGPTAAYGSTTTVHSIGTGSTPVSATLLGLAPGTTYHFRLVLQEGSYLPLYQIGADLTFTTESAIAQTGNTTSVTSTGADVHGLADPVDPHSSWVFQFGKTSRYGSTTPIQSIGTGLHAVSALLTGLTPGTTYHYRIVVTPLGAPGTYALGAERTFKTPAAARFGKAKLVSHRLKVKGGFVAMPFKCTGAHGVLCRGKISLTARPKTGKAVNCGKGTFRDSGGRAHVVRVKVSRQCAGLLTQAAKHSISATLKATFSTHQGVLKQRVTLFE